VSRYSKLFSAAISVLVVLLGCGKIGNAVSEVSVSLDMSKKVPQDVVKIINAIDMGDMATLRSLLEGGAKPTPEGSPLSPIHATITHFAKGKLVCHVEALRLLLAHGADPNFVDQYSKFAPLEDALAMGERECIKLLKEAGAQVDQQGLTGQSILQFAVKGVIRSGDVSLLALVLSWGVDINVLSIGHKWTALMEAAATPGGEFVVAELLRLGADACVKNTAGLTALDLAEVAYEPSQEILSSLKAVMSKC
jgi:ankyrin repeat protein